MKLQAITVSVNYSDFLCWTIVENKHLFDRWIIVTDLKDYRTKELCDNYGVECIQTDVFYESGSTFNKYAGLNEGLKYLDRNEWILILDSDIVLHHQTKYVLEQLILDKSCVYGIDRVNCYGLKNWLAFVSIRNMVYQNWMLHSSGMEFGARLVHYFGEESDNGKFVGWRPLGFFQLIHGSSFKVYPQKTIGADHCDLQFIRENYSRNKRILIPELMAIHLESKNTFKGMNWYGRKSAPFTLESKVKLTDWIKIFFQMIRIFFKSIFRY